ncbi:MAG: peptidoglycan-binding protein [Reyranella sp.]|nr:peptidoglycan-binding protein [Reyranella sp.]
MTRSVFSALSVFALVCATAWPAAADDSVVEVKLVVKDRLTNASVNAAVYSFRTCSSNPRTCAALDVHDAGKSPLTMKCSKGEMLFARLSVSGYVQQSTEAVCSLATQPIVLLATKDRDPDWLMRAGNELLNRGDRGAGAVLLNEANAQRPSAASREAALLAAARALNVNENDALVFDRLQQMKVPTTTFVEAIKVFQRNKNLAADGVLGSQTLGALVESNSSGEAIRKLAIEDMSKWGRET